MRIIPNDLVFCFLFFVFHADGACASGVFIKKQVFPSLITLPLRNGGCTRWRPGARSRKTVRNRLPMFMFRLASGLIIFNGKRCEGATSARHGGATVINVFFLFCVTFWNAARRRRASRVEKIPRRLSGLRERERHVSLARVQHPANHR